MQPASGVLTTFRMRLTMVINAAVQNLNLTIQTSMSNAMEKVLTFTRLAVWKMMQECASQAT